MSAKPVNYAKLDYDRQRHHVRFKRFVESRPRPLICPYCKGAGGYTEYVLEWTGPFVPCGFCEGLGITSPKNWCAAMQVLREEKAIRCRTTNE